MKPEDYDYVVKNNICLFQKGPLSQWWGGFKGQESSFKVHLLDMYFLYRDDYIDLGKDNGGLLDTIYKEYKHLYFNCCEQWMMACKAILFNDAETFKKIMDTKSPKQQKDLGRQIKNYDQEVWDYRKYHIVYKGNMYKFEQNEELKEFLLSFNSFLIFAEASSWDKIWGIGMGPDNPDSLDVHKWQGENLLGKALMEVREFFKS